MLVGGSGQDYLFYKMEELSMEKEFVREKVGIFEGSVGKIIENSMKKVL